MNTHNPVVTTLLGFNNNVTSGNRDAMYYITMYSTKKNQEEECFPFRKECTAIAKRIRAIQERNQRIATSASSFGDPVNIENEPSYGMGLGHVLSGITAHLWSSIISAPMAWYLVVNGSRFRFSHEFVTIPLSQVEGWLLHKDIQLRYRRNKKTNSGWLDSTLLNYLFRPSAEIYPKFQNMSLWEFYHFAKLQKLKRTKVPVLYYQKGLHDIEKCKIHNEFVTPETEFERNHYATIMLLLFCPYRYRDDLGDFEKRWELFCSKVNNKHKLYEKSQTIMQNIQNVHNSTKLSTPKDQIFLETYLRDSEKIDRPITYDSDDSCCEDPLADDK